MPPFLMYKLPSIDKVIQTIENLKLKNEERVLILFFIILLRNLLESQFEFPGYIGFVKIPIDSFFAFFLHFPLFYIALFYSLYLLLSWLRGEQEKILNVLVIGFGIILIPPLFDCLILKRQYHISYFVDFESYIKGLMGVVVPWIKGVEEVSWGQRIEVYLTDILVFFYLLANRRGIIRAIGGLLLTHLIIACFGGVGMILVPFTQKSWLLFSHHQAYIQFFGIYLLVVYTLRHKEILLSLIESKELITLIGLIVFTTAGFLYCLKLNLPLNLPPFLFSSLISLYFLNLAFVLQYNSQNLLLGALGLCLAFSVRYEVFVLAVLLILMLHIKKIIRLLIFKGIVSGMLAIASLYIGTAVFFFYNTISLTPPILVLVVFLVGTIVGLNRKPVVWLPAFSVVIITGLFAPPQKSINEHINLLLSSSLFKEGRYRDIPVILKDTEKNDIVNFLIGASLVNLGNAQKGLVYLDRCSEVNRDIIVAKLAGANQCGQFERGLEALEQGLRNGIMPDELYLEKARQLVLMNELGQAEKFIDSALVFGARMIDCYNLLGDIYNQKGEYSTAIIIYKKAQKIDPGDYYAYAQEGMIQFSLKNYDGSIQSFQTAIKLNPKDPFVRNNLGVVLRTIGEFPKARREFLLALELAPGFIEPLYNLGLIALGEGKTEEAIYWLERALKINPDFTPAQNTLKEILK